jgi:hypothetical protein
MGDGQFLKLMEKRSVFSELTLRSDGHEPDFVTWEHGPGFCNVERANLIHWMI